LSELNNKVVIITGGGSGLGKEAATAFAKAGAKVVICGRRLNKIQEVEQTMRTYTNDILALKADVSVEKDVQELIKMAVAKFGRVDILLNNAAVFENYPIADTTLDSWAYHIENNVTSVFLMMKEIIPVMRNQKSGTIINITSGLARDGAAGFGAYSASKAAVETLTYSVNEEEFKHGIRTFVFNPGVMKTELQAMGDDPATIAPYLLELSKLDASFSGKLINIEDLRALTSN
jgi:3-oxoacyl-[acyl-carrier protein] reductase